MVKRFNNTIKMERRLDDETSHAGCSNNRRALGMNDENEREIESLSNAKRPRVSQALNLNERERENEQMDVDDSDNVRRSDGVDRSASENRSDSMGDLESVDRLDSIDRSDSGGRSDSVDRVDSVDGSASEGRSESVDISDNIEAEELEDLLLSNSDDDEEDDREETTEESDSDSHPEDDDYANEQPPRPMFQGLARRNEMRRELTDNGELKAIDHLLIELTFTVKYNNTYEQLLQRLQLLKKTYVRINVPTTKKALWKTLGRDDSNLVYRLYCEMCSQLIGNGKKVERDCDCGACGPEKDESFVGTFIQIRLAPQIKEFLDSPKAATALQYKETRVKIDPDAIEDIYDGREYLRISQDFLNNRNNYTLTLWTDGLKLAKSSKASCYPFLLQLNELSPHARKRYMFMAGIWVGKKTPNMGKIMESMVDDLNELHDTGITWRPTPEREVVSKFAVVILTADSVAKPVVLRMKQYNGEYGCTFCLAQGKSVERRWIFNAEPIVPRTSETMNADVRALMATGIESRGVLGCSRLLSLRRFEFIKGQVVDIAHKDYLGNVKTFNERHMTDVGKGWYIGQRENKKKINDILTTIKTPSRISRKSRRIETSNVWKASEWRNYQLYYLLPCLDGVLPEPYFSHQVKYCEALFILNNQSITNADLNKAKTFMVDVANETENLYGEVNMRFNIHLNYHSDAEDWGPAWVYSTLPFESMNRPIAESVKSPNHRAEQIVTRFFMKKFILRTAEEEEISRTTRKIVDDLLDKKTVQVPADMPECHYFVGTGRPELRRASPEVIELLVEVGKEIEENTLISYFQKAYIHGVKYAKKTDVPHKYCDHIAYCRDKKFILIKNIISYQNQEEKISGFIGEEFEDLGGAYNTEYMRFVRQTRINRFVSYCDVLAPGIIIEATKGTVAVNLCNCWETD
ncbi:uncharacterized protein LOC127286354 isoform X1 [Leptopilina boulardi]|uniref:uncharacterized protein LOC127286354 isoform X1 n=1 Tax=Leptopilina boulardi TaxID=63433 RepID=UPI0021F59F99|nr:uncharacterized protein LOC127286354 isoform X1 [Leptopilina boulardi]